MSSVSCALPAMCALHGVAVSFWQGMDGSEEICVWYCLLWGNVGRYQSVKHIRKGLSKVVDILASPMDRPIRHVGGIVLAGGKGKPMASGTFASSVQC